MVLPMNEFLEVKLPVSRGNGLVRGLLWCVAGAITGQATALVVRGLRFSPSGVSNQMEDYALALLMLPIGLAAAACIFSGGRWLLLAAWPAPLGMRATKSALHLDLGPFGGRRFSADRFTIRYPFEFDDADDGGFEACLPEEQQIATLLPQMRHPDSGQPVDRVILRFTTLPLQEVVRILGPAIERWRTRPNDAGADERSACEQESA